MIKKITVILVIFLGFSCSSNTIYKEPKDLIPKDTMVSLLTDMMIATSAKNKKNKKLQRKINYMPLVYDTYKIDSVRFQKSNVYYMSNIEEYQEIFKQVQLTLETLQSKYKGEKKLKDSLFSLRVKKKRMYKKEIELDTLKTEEEILLRKEKRNVKGSIKNEESLKIIEE